ncbi:hypothetical protein C8N43_3187 [Litoreibacter ponti]|uniref:Uncharacterized protein n=1 Tax=Litoreibacter ponti TaxID=1510457 RepID=A0A2T6BE83_9RHOB|nr:hypothetical protein [Litoreibacter ponti]PTX54373.1 hypothetical protein C8N43_3187 [Litoreibacter ponti]
MTALTLEDSTDSDRFVINLTRSGGGEILVNSIEIANGEMRNRYSFRADRDVFSVLQRDVAQHILEAIAKLRTGERILSLPDFLYSIPGLVLSGMRILSSPFEGGGDSIMVRFKYYVGAIKEIFQFEPSMAVASHTVRERIAVDVLHDIVSPLFDILSLSQSNSRGLLTDHAQAVGRRLDRLDVQMEELKFYSGLLQRYVAGCQQDALEGRLDAERKPAPPQLDTQQGNEQASEPSNGARKNGHGANEHMN